MCGKLPKSGSAWPQLVRRTRYIFGGKNETREGERGITPTWLTRFFVLGANLLPTESYTGLRVTLGYTELRVFYVGNQPPRLSEPQQAGDGVATIAIIEPLQKQNKNYKPDENSESTKLLTVSTVTEAGSTYEVSNTMGALAGSALATRG